MEEHWDYEFALEGSCLHSLTTPVLWGESAVEVLPGLVFLLGEKLVSHSILVPLRDFLSSLLAPKKEATSSDGAGRLARGGNLTKATLVAENAWVVGYIEDVQAILKKYKRGGNTELEGFGDEGSDEEACDIVGADFCAEVADLLAKATAEAKADHLGSFRVHSLGGPWTKAHLGVAMDAWEGRAVGQDAIAWCTKYKLHICMRFNVNLYEHDGALIAARFFTQKM